MANKRYYWLKLKEDFFEEDTIAWLEEQENGKDYALFYLKLCLKSLKTDGLLIRSVGNMLVPYDVKKLAEITKTDFDTAVVAMELLKKIGLVEVLDSGEIFLTKLSEMVGSETNKAESMRRLRSRKEQGNSVTPLLPEQGNSVALENRDKSIEIEKEKDKKKDTARQSDVIEKEFESLWSLYPRKHGKANALKAYTKARKGNKEVYQKVEDGIKAYIAYLEKNRTDPRYIAQGSTWFNQQRWLDDYTSGGGNDERIDGDTKKERTTKSGYTVKGELFL